MIRFPNAKINLGLNVVEKRSDGYHNIETIFYPLPIYDSLEVIESDVSNRSYEFSSSGIVVDGAPEKNLIIKALNLISSEYKLPSLKIHLHKVIPMGGGLGGGSSDGAFMLKMVNDMFELKLSDEDLINLAVKLGADCPFFIHNKPVYATGIGEVLEPIELSLSGVYLMLLNPNIHVSTALAFSKINPKKSNISVRDIIAKPRSAWKDLLINDFEPSVFSTFPIINDLKNSLYLDGAFYSSMSGSGASVYALFDSKPNLNHFSEYVIWEGYL